MTRREGGLSDDLRALGAMLRGASETFAGVAGDAHFRRLLAIFTAIPAEDREILLGVLEREVALRRAYGDTEPYIGLELHINPHARLYVRALATTNPSHDQDEMMLATGRLPRVARLLLSPKFHGTWAAASHAAFARMEPAERAAIARMVDELRRMLAEHEPAGGK